MNKRILILFIHQQQVLYRKKWFTKIENFVEIGQNRANSNVGLLQSLIYIFVITIICEYEIDYMQSTRDHYNKI